MVRKEVGIIFLLVFAVFFIGFVSSASCSITTSCAAANTVMKLSATTNAHGELYSGSTYSYYLCCDFTGTHTCSITNTVLRLSSTTNAHAEIPYSSTYSNRVCFGNLTCYTTSSSCNAGDMQMVSLSSTTNAHIGTFSTYSTKICCSPNLDYCGDTICNGVETCSSCPSDCGCISPQTCGGGGTPGVCGCTPNCAGKNCGSNGCGGTCGSCQVGWSCSASGTCIGCGDGQCNNGETCSSCSADCGVCCGNGIREGTETCDDGDLSSGDGCSATCAVEAGYTCTGGPSVCTLCTINSAYWNPSSGIKDGDTVTLGITTNSACNGKAFTFLVRRNALIDSTISTINSVAPSSGSATRSWFVDIANEGNYYLRATLDEKSSVTRDSGDVAITFPPSCGDGTCNAGETCSCSDCPCPSPQECISGTCALPCDLTNAYWSPSSGVKSGDIVSLTAVGSNCNGKTITFEVREEDFLSYDYIASPSSRIMSSGIATTSWTATAPDPDGETSPTYYFIATVSDDSDSYRSGNMIVTIPVIPPTCGNGIREGTEGCDDGDKSSGDGCSATCTVESGWTCNSATPNVCTPICGDGLIRGTETCDDADTNSGDGCSYPACTIESGYTCVGEPSVCNPITSCGINGCQPGLGENCQTCLTDCPCLGGTICESGSCVMPPVCGDGLIRGTEGCDDADTNSGDGCSYPACTVESGYTCTGEPSICIQTPPVGNCDLTSASWSVTSALTGDLVRLNIEGTNCNGKEISFIVMEKDGFPDGDDSLLDLGGTDPAPITYTSKTKSGTWTAEWYDDKGSFPSFEENPPEYYFTAAVEGTSESITSSNINADDPLLLRVYDEDVVCAGINYCSNYATESDCESDLCTTGVNSVPETITCGGTFNPETGCYDYTNCGCAWNAISGVCEANWKFESSCEVCGNHVRDFGEECDDGNTASGDGCSATCEFEGGILNPCGEGLTLCLDLTCSLNCYDTDISVSECNYDGYCDTNEGCTCSDCDGEQDACEEGLLCTKFNTACCTTESDYECNPYCSFVDPDCTPANCGNGFMELGEECDLGIRNGVTNSGCSDICTLEPITPGENGCPEGTTLCSDLITCSLNCYETDEGAAECNGEPDGYCDVGVEGCTCSDCDGEVDTCEAGLVCSIVDQACCDSSSDGFCNQYCAFVDPDCKSQGPGEKGIFSPGTCIYTENGQDTCDDDGMITRSLSALWIWDPENVLHLDPLGKQGSCAYIEDTFSCPASVEVPFFGIYQLAIAIAIVILIYLIYALKKKNHSKFARKKIKK